MVEAGKLTLDRLAKQRFRLARELYGDVAQPDAAQVRPRVKQGFRHKAGGICKVDEPRVRRCVFLHGVRDLVDHGNGAKRAGQAAEPRGLLSDQTVLQGDAFVENACGHLADTDLRDDIVRVADGLAIVAVALDTRLGRRFAQHAFRQSGEDLAALRVRIAKREGVDMQTILTAEETIDQFRRVCASCSDDGDTQ